MKEAEKISKQTQKVIQSGWEQAADRVEKSFSQIADESNRMNVPLSAINRNYREAVL